MRRLAAATRGWWADIRRATSTCTVRCWTDPGRGAAGRLRLPRARRPPAGSWWDWAPAKHVLEDLFDQGRVVHDRVNFERRYDLAERVLPPGVDTTEPTAAEAALELTLLAAGALGVGTAADLADYYRLRPAEAKAALAEAVAGGLLQEVAVAGRPAYLLPGTRVPRRGSTRRCC